MLLIAVRIEDFASRLPPGIREIFEYVARLLSGCRPVPRTFDIEVPLAFTGSDIVASEPHDSNVVDETASTDDNEVRFCFDMHLNGVNITQTGDPLLVKQFRVVRGCGPHVAERSLHLSDLTIRQYADDEIDPNLDDSFRLELASLSLQNLPAMQGTYSTGNPYLASAEYSGLLAVTWVELGRLKNQAVPVGTTPAPDRTRCFALARMRCVNTYKVYTQTPPDPDTTTGVEIEAEVSLLPISDIPEQAVFPDHEMRDTIRGTASFSFTTETTEMAVQSPGCVPPADDNTTRCSSNRSVTFTNINEISVPVAGS